MEGTRSEKLGTQGASAVTRDVNWDKVRQRLASANEAPLGFDETLPEVMEKVWAQRAAVLAQAPPQEQESEQVQLALVRLGSEIYAFEAHQIVEIWIAEQITRVPRVPEWVAGAVNLRGHILSTIDLRRYLGLPATAGRPLPSSAGEQDSTEHDQKARLLVAVETPKIRVVLLVDDVLGVESLPMDQIQDRSDTLRGIRAEYVRGVVEYDHKGAVGSGDGNRPLAIVLNLATLLDDEQLIIREEIA